MVLRTRYSNKEMIGCSFFFIKIDSIFSMIGCSFFLIKIDSIFSLVFITTLFVK